MNERESSRLILVADADEEATRALIPQLLEHGVATTVSTDGADALLQIGRMRPDILLVAADLPLLGGATLVRVLRRRLQTPILLGVGPDDGDRAIDGLAAGATACVARPYRLGEVLPLVTAGRYPLPQSSLDGGPGGRGEVLEAGALRLDRAAHEVRLYGRVLPMPPKEMDLLAFLMRNRDHVVSHDAIRDHVWGPGEGGGTNTVVVHIRRLRARLGDAVGTPRILVTVRGVGYRLVPPADAPARTLT
jgi:DNA-binding response OmpR family regulator